MIKLRNISKYYSKNQTVSLGLRKINLDLGLNEFVAIVGESGSGKTTLLNVISGIDSYEEGEMYINDEETSYFSSADWENYRKKYIAFIFQNYNLIESYSVLQNVEAALILSGYPKDQLRKRALEIIDRVGLTDHIKHKATKLSGGQKQRVVIARAIAKDAPIIVADEPTGNLDSESAKNIIDLLAEIAQDKLVIVVTHDFSQVESQATRRIRIFDGEIVEDKKIVKKEVKDLPSLEDQDYQMNFLETIKMVFRNLFATPKKSLLMLIIFLVSTFFFAFIYASFLANQNQQTSSTGLGYEPNTRILVNKTDGTAFTEAELLAFKNDRRVNIVMPYDYLLEEQIRFGGTLRVTGLDSISFSTMIMPITILGDYGDSLSSGESAIALSFADDLIEDGDLQEIEGSDLSLYAQAYRQYIDYELEVKHVYSYLDIYEKLGEISGVVVFLSEEDWNAIGHTVGFLQYTSIDVSYTYSDETYIRNIYRPTMILNTNLDDDEITVPRYFMNVAFTLPDSMTTDVSLSDLYEEESYTGIEIQFTNNNYIEVSQSIYDDLFDSNNPYQISIFTHDGIDGVNLSNQLNRNADYFVFYPAGAKTNNQFTGLVLFIMNIGFFISFGLLFLVIFFVAYVIIKNIINSKMNDYAIFRTIGANKATIRSFIYLETMFVAILAYIVFVLFVQIGSPYFTIESYFYVLKFYTFKNLIYLLMFILVYSLLLSRRYLSRVYHDTVAQTLKGGDQS